MTYPEATHAAEKLATLRKINHPECILCGQDDRLGLGLNFTVTDDGSVTTDADCDEFFQSYSGQLHGGILALLLDGAMTNCLFAVGVTAVTGELAIRYLHPVTAGKPVKLTARLKKTRPPLYLVEAELCQDGETAARASGKFIER